MFLRLVKWGAGLAALAALGLAVWHFRLWERDWSTIDDGWASLIGSAVGSFLAVAGALYVAKSEERRKRKEFEEFVKVAVQNLVVQASYLEAMAREPLKVAPTPEVQAGIISIQLRNLTDALLVFDREITGSKDGAYNIRRQIVSTDAALREVRPLLNLESEPIQALENWHVGAYQIRHHASAMLDAFGWDVLIPSSKLIGETIKKAVATWRSWNIPSSASIPPSPNFHVPNHGIHNAHA